MNLKYQTGK